MTIPNEPLTRAEQYLNKIATGSGNTPDEPLTRIEMYLAEIAKNEGGGGSGGGVFVVGVNMETMSLDKTAGEIVQALPQKTVCLYLNDTDNEFTGYLSLINFELEDGIYDFMFGQDGHFRCESENDYPSSVQ